MLWVTTGALRAQNNRVFLFPSGGNPNVTVIDAASLAVLGSIPASPNVVQAVGLPDGSKYYVVSNNPAGSTITVANASLGVIRQITLPATASAAVVTPDGRRLLVTAATLRVYDTATDSALAAVSVGAGPTDIEVTNDSARAYVMSGNGSLVTAVNLTNNTVASVAFPQPLAIALTPSNTRLLVLEPNRLSIVNPLTNSVQATVALSLAFGKILVTPDSSRAVVLNQSSPPLNISQVVDLTSQAVTQIGNGVQGFDQIVLVDSSTAFGILTGTNTVARIDLGTGAVTIQSYGANTRRMDVAPNGKTLYLTSVASPPTTNVSRVDVTTNSVAASTSVPVAPSGLAVVFPPPTTGATGMALNGGDRQNLVAGQSTPFPMSVRVTTTDGSPVFNYPVTFATTATGATITPTQQPVRTNSRGIAQAFLTTPPPAPSTLEAEPTVSAASESLSDGEPVAQGIETISVSATAAGTPGVTFTITVGLTTGIVVLSGNYQVTGISQPFPLPFAVRVTGLDGLPVPAGTEVTFFLSGVPAIFPFSVLAPTDAEGVARATFSGGSRLSNPGSFVEQTSVTAIVSGRSELGTAIFTATVSLILPTRIDAVQGNDQTGAPGELLPVPLGVQLFSGFDSPFNLGFVGVYWSVVSGPAGVNSAILNPAVSVTDAGGRSTTSVTIGPRVGVEPIIIRAVVPGLSGEALFTLRTRGGPPQTITILQGNNQEGRPGTQLPVALRVRVLDFFGNPVRLPNTQFPLTLEVSPSGAATLSSFFQQENGEASVLVNIGNFSGPFTVTATSGNGRAVFNLRALSAPAVLVLVSGNNQRVGVTQTTAEPFVVRVNDSQGNPAPGAPVTFSGPAGITLIPAEGSSGNPVTVNTGADGQASVRARAAAGTVGNITITASSSVGSVSFTLTVLPPPPVFSATSIVNAASFVPGLVPCAFASLFGSNLSTVTGIEQPGGATSHRGVSVSIDGVAVPLFLVSNIAGQEQITFQMRCDAAAPSTVFVEVNNGGTRTIISGVPVSRIQPAMFEYTPATTTQKYAAAVKLNGSVIGPANAVGRGDVLLLFANALGPTLPILGTGQVGPVPPAETFFRPVVRIGGVESEVLFSGLTPTFIGLYQINVRVPENASPGQSIPISVTVEGVTSPNSLIAVQ